MLFLLQTKSPTHFLLKELWQLIDGTWGHKFKRNKQHLKNWLEMNKTKDSNNFISHLVFMHCVPWELSGIMDRAMCFSCLWWEQKGTKCWMLNGNTKWKWNTNHELTIMMKLIPIIRGLSDIWMFKRMEQVFCVSLRPWGT